MRFLDNRFYWWANRASSYLLLGGLWFLCSLPLLTLFPATAAMFATFRAWQDNPDDAFYLSLFDIFAGLGWINTFLPLVVPVFFGSAFWIFLMRQFLLQIPMDISDAGRIDGANEFQVFSQLILPLTLPSVGVIGIFAALSAWNDFIGPLIYLQDESRYTLAIGLTFFRSQYDVQFNLLMAASTLIVLPVVVIFLLFQRAFLDGITLGSVK